MSNSFSWVGNNVAGVRSKWGTLKRWVREKDPSIVTLQETKCPTKGAQKLNGFVVFEHLRTEKCKGGGLLFACKRQLNPALVRDGGDEVEAITVDINVKKMKISCTTAYGPQKNDPKVKIDKFWQYLEEESKKAKLEGKGYILQGDLNAWLGSRIIPNDPRDQNKNGKIMEDFLIRNQLTVVNSLPKCKGLITRIRKCLDKYQESVIDFFVVCELVLPHVVSMEVDDKKKHVLTNYTQVKRGGRAVDSDHVPLELKLDLKHIPTKPARVVLYDNKNRDGQKRFKDLTSETQEFTDCFNSLQPLLDQCDDWLSSVHSYCEKAFPLVRIRARQIKKSSADDLIKKRNVLVKKMENGSINKSEEMKKIEIDNEIAEILAKEEMTKAQKFKQYCAEDGSILVSKMWKLKKHVWPKHRETLPVGKLNHQGRMVSSPTEIKDLLVKEYTERLRSRPVHPDLVDVIKLKEKTFQLKLEHAKANATPDWEMSELENVLKNVDKTKCRDPEGISRSIFHESIIGKNLKESILIMFNLLKKEGKVANFMRKATITTIPKKGSKFVLKNERGIFIVNSVRTLLMRLLYNTKYDIIEKNMSDSNVGEGKKGAQYTIFSSSTESFMNRCQTNTISH